MLRDVAHRVEYGPDSRRTGAPPQSSLSHSDLKLGLLSSPLGQSRKLRLRRGSMTQPIERQARLKPGLLETRVVPRAGAHKVPGAGTKETSTTG